MRDLLSITVECIQELKDIGIPIQDDRVNEVKFARLPKGDAGICTLYSNNTFCIKISLFFKNEKTDISELRATICHELLHTCPDCYEHTGQWIGYGSATYKTDFDLKNKHMPVIHRLRCSRCGGYWNIRKECDWKRVQKGEKGICVWCGNYYTIDF